MTFRGRFLYDNDSAASRAVHAFCRAASEDCVVFSRDLVLEGKSVHVDVEATAPASWWECTCDALCALGEEARDGVVEAACRDEDEQQPVLRVRVLAGGEERELGADEESSTP